MTHGTTRFYIANLAADITRSMSALAHNDEARYRESLERTSKTLAQVREMHAPHAYEEALLLISGFTLAREDGALPAFKHHLDSFTATLLQ